MPKSLQRRLHRDARVKKKMKEVFDQFYRLNAGSSHYVCKFLEVYEKDRMCGCHVFPLKLLVCSYNCVRGSKLHVWYS